MFVTLYFILWSSQVNSHLFHVRFRPLQFAHDCASLAVLHPSADPQLHALLLAVLREVPT